MTTPTGALSGTAAALTRSLATGEPQHSLADWHAPDGALYSLARLSYDAARVDRSRTDLLRYRAFLPLARDAETLGVGGTPIRTIQLGGSTLLVKDESESPTGSFKDRGMCVLANLARGHDGPVFVDSVGNTAAALARYARELGLEAHVFAPLSTSPERARIVTDLGARLHLVAGPRAESARVALEVASSGALYLSHIYQPLFHAGTATCAFEIHEQTLPEGTGEPTARETPPTPVRPVVDRIFLAVGQGSLLLGLHHGFRALVTAGELVRPPRLHAVRPERPAETIAVGAAAVHPVRAQEARNAVRATGGREVRVPERALRAAREALQAADIHVDPAAALALAGQRILTETDGAARDLIILTGADRERPMAT